MKKIETWVIIITILMLFVGLIYLNNKFLDIVEINNTNVDTNKNLTKIINDDKLLDKQKDIDFKKNLLKSIDHLNPYVDPQIKDQIVKSLIEECESQKLPPLLILCLIKEESNYNPMVENSLGAIGLMQIIPKYHQDKIKKLNLNKYELFHIRNNIILGTQILRQYFDQNNNDIVKGLQKYVGATIRSNAGQYIENIINNYISLQIIYFTDYEIQEELPVEEEKH